jgi:hypothetical protein
MIVSDILETTVSASPLARRFRMLRRQHLVRLMERAEGRPLAQARIKRELDNLVHFYVPSAESVADGIKYAEKSGAFIALHDTVLKVTWTTDPITLRDDNGDDWELGRFKMCAQYEFSDQEIKCQAVALDPSPSIYGHTHPHVSDERVCLGDASRSVLQAFQNGHYDTIMDVVNAMMATYNSESPYFHLEQWEGAVCPFCDGKVDELKTCYECEQEFCAACGLEDYRWYCPDCCERCEGCEVLSRNTIVVPCCGRHYCRECLDV